MVPWSIRGARREPGEIPDPRDVAEDLNACARCGAALGDVHLVVRNRGRHRIPDSFCSVVHMADCAKAGGRWSG